jgi:hypothetical protein
MGARPSPTGPPARLARPAPAYDRHGAMPVAMPPWPTAGRLPLAQAAPHRTLRAGWLLPRRATGNGDRWSPPQHRARTRQRCGTHALPQRARDTGAAVVASCSFARSLRRMTEGLGGLAPSPLLASPRWGEVTCGGGNTAHADDTLTLLILQRESSWCFLYTIRSILPPHRVVYYEDGNRWQIVSANFWWKSPAASLV